MSEDLPTACRGCRWCYPLEETRLSALRARIMHRLGYTAPAPIAVRGLYVCVRPWFESDNCPTGMFAVLPDGGPCIRGRKHACADCAWALVADGEGQSPFCAMGEGGARFCAERLPCKYWEPVRSAEEYLRLW